MRLRFFLFLFFGYTAVFAQIKFETESDKDGNITIYADNQDIIPTTLEIEFATLLNLISTNGKKIFTVAYPGRSVVARLKRSNMNQNTSLNYSTKMYRGNYIDKSKNEVVYLLPIQEGQKVTIQPLENIENFFKGESENKNYVGTAIYFEEPTIICAPRKGIVSGIKMGEQVKGSNLTFNSSENFIEIYHEDGTFTRLIVLEAGSEKVKLGDVVFPGQGLASSSGDKYSSGMHVKMFQTRLQKINNSIVQKALPVKLFVEGQEVSSEESKADLIVSHPQHLIIKEMNKKELKRL
jgi:hypothetical protein